MVTLSTPTPVSPTLKRIEILGVFGAGKSTLATRIAESSKHHLAEDHEANPYWGLQRTLQVTGYLPYDGRRIRLNDVLHAMALDR